MLLQIKEGVELASKAFEFNFLVGMLTSLLLLAILGMWFINKERKAVQDSKDVLVKESLGLITLVESQLVENKTSNELINKNSNEVLTQILLIKKDIESIKK